MKKRFLQKCANFIANRMKTSTTDTDFDVWLNMGQKLDKWCVDRDIWLE